MDGMEAVAAWAVRFLRAGRNDRKNRPGKMTGAVFRQLAVFTGDPFARRLPGQRKAGLPAAVAVTAVAAATTTATRSGGLRPGLVNSQRATLHVSAVQPRDCLPGCGIVRHLDETEAAGATGFAVGDYLGGFHLAILAKGGAQVFIAGAKWKVAYKDIQTRPPGRKKLLRLHRQVLS
jgi:hypothetical protein